MSKKLLSILLSASMAISICACGNEKENSKESEKISEVTAEQSQESSSTTTSLEEVPEEYVPTYPIVDEPITVRGVVVSSNTTYYADTRLVWEEVEKLTGINIEWEVIEKEALPTYMAGGDWPDFFHCNLDATTVNDYGITGGRFINYLDYIDIMPNLAQTYKDYPMTLAASTQLNGEVYNLFKVSGPASTAVTTRAFVRTDILDEAGIAGLPNTIDEFYEQLKILKEKNGEPGWVPSSNLTANDLQMLVYGAFGTLDTMTYNDDGTGKVVFGRTSDQMKYYLQFMNKCYEEGLIHPEYMTLDNTAVNQLCQQSGKVAYITQAAANGMKQEFLKDNKWEYLTCLAPLTSEYDNTRTLQGYFDYANACGMYINADSQYVEEICKMLDIAFATEEVSEGSGLLGQTFMYGMQGRDWWINDDGTYAQKAPEEYGSFSTYQTGALIWVNFGRGDYWGDAVTETVGNAQARQKGFVENAIPYQVTDHIFNTSAIKFTEDEQYTLDNRLTDIANYCSQMEAEFITGVKDIESNWAEYVATVEKMGIQDVLKVYQTAYDRFNEAMSALDK